MESQNLGSLELAYVGDGVYELFVRTYLAEQGNYRIGELHRRAVAFVSAPAQCRAAKALLPSLPEEERAVLLRGRNCHTHGCPHGATQEEYSYATALEALFGWLYLHGKNERARELFDECVAILLEKSEDL